MAIRIPNLGTGNGLTGDNELVIRENYNSNFSDQINAASRLVGTAAGNVMEVGAFGLGTNTGKVTQTTDVKTAVQELSVNGSQFFRNNVNANWAWGYSAGLFAKAGDTFTGITAAYAGGGVRVFAGAEAAMDNIKIYDLYHTLNVTKDANGFLKGASPVIDMYDNKIDLNHDATEQGGITFEKLGVGNYLVKGSLGFAQEGWYIETPKDANGNVLVAVVYEQLANNDLSIKTYAKRFDDETGDIVANLTKPRDIPVGRFISLRLHELPKEPQVMPTETQTEV